MRRAAARVWPWSSSSVSRARASRPFWLPGRGVAATGCSVTAQARLHPGLQPAVRLRLGGQVWLDPPVLDAYYAPLLPGVPMRIDTIRRARVHAIVIAEHSFGPAPTPQSWRPRQITGNYPRNRGCRIAGIPHARGIYATHTAVPGTEAPLPGGEAALVGLAALVVVFLPFLWPLVEHFNAMAHEGAHAVVGSPMGFGIKGVTLSIETPRRNSSRPGTLLPCYGSQSCSWYCCCS